MINQKAFIHPTSIIEDGAKIGKNVHIDPYCIIKKDVTIGDGTTIGSHCLIEGNTTIGNDNHIFAHNVIGTVPQDLKYEGEKSELIIGSNNSIREFCLINIGTKGGGNKTIIGDNNLLMSHNHIAHDCIISNNVICATNAIIGGHVVIKNDAFIGGSVAIHQFVKIGEYSMLAGGSILTQDLPPFCLAEGNRALVKSLNKVGLRRKLPNEVDSFREVFKYLFRNKDSQQSLTENAKSFYDKTQNIYVKSLCEFIIDSKRGIPTH